MSDLRSRVEVMKLARELGIAEADLEFLRPVDAGALRDLRGSVADALFANHRSRFELLAALTRLLPNGITARIAQHALGPLLSSRVAAVLKPDDAAGLACHLPASFVTDIASNGDPGRLLPVIARLPEDLIVQVGLDLLDRREYLTLGRFVSSVDLEIIMRVVERATSEDLLAVGLFTEEPAALDGIMRRVDDDTLGGVVRAAAAGGHFDDAVTLLTALSPESCARLMQLAARFDEPTRAGVVTAIIANDVWPALMPAIPDVPADALAGFVNLPETADPAVVESIVRHAHGLDASAAFAHVLAVADTEHLAVFESSPALADPAVREWAAAAGWKATV